MNTLKINFNSHVHNYNTFRTALVCMNGEFADIDHLISEEHISQNKYVFYPPTIIRLDPHFVQQLDVYEHCMTRKTKAVTNHRNCLTM